MRRHSGKKRLGAVLLSLALCLGLLPVTALAVDTAPQTLYVGSTTIGTGYWTSSDGGKVWTSPADEPEGNNYIYYDGQGTLKLHNVTIQGADNTGSPPYGAGIYALCSQDQPVALTIELIGTNTITGYYGIFLNAEIDASSYGTNATLTITGENNGSLGVSGSDHGIYVKSGTGNASINIKNVAVTSSTNGNSAAGVYVMSSSTATNSPNISLSVDGGSLTASGTGSSDGIWFYVGSSQATGATTSLTVSDNAIVRANGGIKASRVDEPTPSGTGIVFDGKEGTVYGDVTLDESLTINQDETLTIPDGSKLDCNEKLTNNGTINVEDGGTVTGNLSGGTAVTTPNITAQPTGQTVTEGSAATFSVTASAGDSETLTYQWQQSTASGSDWTDISQATSASYTTEATTTNMSGNQYRCVVKSASGVSVISSAATLTVQAKPAPVSVTGVSLDKATLELYTGDTATLTATVEPDNADNKDVTWKSNNESVATVDTSGKVTAVGAGTATITATAADGSEKYDTCTVTVTQPVTGVTLDKPSMTLTEGDSETLTATVEPSNATNKNVTWSSSDPSVATVANGVVTAVGAGTATITVTTEDGGKTAICTVTVERPYVPPANPNYRIDVTTTEGGTVDKDPAAAKAGETVSLTPTPDAGYEVADVTVTDRFGDAVAVTENPDGTYTFTMPNGQVKVEVTFVEAAPEPLPFTDVKEGDWFHDAVQYAYENGLMDGVGDGQFAPNATTNRAMVVTILYRLADEPAVSGDVAFTDVESGLWYSNAVLWAAQKGIVNGVSETEFAPSGDLTREQLATILYRYAQDQGYDVSAQADLSGFPDAGDIQSYATQALSWAVAEGLLQGFEDDSLQPGGTATRAQIATILMRFCETVAK